MPKVARERALSSVMSGSADVSDAVVNYFADDAEGLRIFRDITSRIHRLGPVSIRVSKSEIAFRRRRSFAFVWRPDRYLRAAGVPAVLSIALPNEEMSPRFKSVVRPSPRVWMHHLELHRAEEVDAEVIGWLSRAYANAG